MIVYQLRVLMCCLFIFFFKQKTAYEMRISDWSSDVCSSDLRVQDGRGQGLRDVLRNALGGERWRGCVSALRLHRDLQHHLAPPLQVRCLPSPIQCDERHDLREPQVVVHRFARRDRHFRERREGRCRKIESTRDIRSEERTSELQSL